METFGQRIKEFRKILNLSQQELAKKLQMQPQALARYEKDKVKPSIDLVKKLTDMFNVNINWLLTGKGEMFLSDEPKLIGINNSIVGQAGHNINGTVHIQTLTNNSSAPKTPNDEKNIQELIETFKQLPPELQDYYLNLMKAELSKYKYEQKKLSQG